jgi:ubiquinone/menaquinone biosynthesis C-methylase UbiE
LSPSRFDRTADRYAQSAARRDWSALAEWCSPAPGDRALDIAAGPGFLSAALLPMLARAVALDESEALLAHAPDGVERVVGDAAALPFPDGSFEIVTCVNSLHHVPDPEAVLGEAARVLSAGGRIVIQDYLADPDADAAARWDEIERLRDAGHHHLPPRGFVAEVLARHGLHLVREDDWESSWKLDDWVGMAECDEATHAQIRERVGADGFSLTAWRGRFERA